ncbi:MAG: hypothetical protein LUE87_06420 [Lachnospiraceae bacterium]|nr:hypothetical protein [Lachnospiraceae bacterium]
MKFKEITPGMVIHCPREQDARTLLKHLEDLKYDVSDAVKIHAYARYKEKTCFYINPNITVSYGDDDFYATDKNFREHEGNLKITEFSDLIEHDEKPIEANDLANPKTEMCAAELLEWLRMASERQYHEVFGVYICEASQVIYSDYEIGEIINKITAYEAAKKAPKPVEVEEGYWYEVFESVSMDKIASKKMWGYTWDETNQLAIKIANDYTKEHGCECRMDMQYICRVKEDKA